MKMPWKFVEVEWKDPCSSLKWADDGVFPTPQDFVTRGWLIHDEMEYLVFAGTIGQDKGVWIYGEVITLPRGCIERISDLGIDYKGEVTGL